MLKNSAPQKCIPSIVTFSRLNVMEHRHKQQAIHNKKLLDLSEEQGKPLFNVKNTVICYELDKEPPEYVLETLSLGPKNAVMDPVDLKQILMELDLFMEYCEKNIIPKDHN